MYRWILSLAAPLMAVYLLTEHPLLVQSSFYGFTANEIGLVHGCLWLLTTILSLLFARSRAVMVGLLTTVFSFGLPLLISLDYDPTTASLAFLAAGICLVAAPEKKVFKVTSLIWLGLSLIFAGGLMTVGEMYGRTSTNYLVLASVALWGTVTLALRCAKGGGKRRVL